MQIETGDIPPHVDEPPETTAPNGDFDPLYPGSTPDAPYGFKPDGTPYRRRPKGTAGGTVKTGNKRMPATDASARAAASLLARMNMLLGIGIYTAGMERTAEAIKEANEQFEVMAYEALQADPQLCRKILGAGASSGKAGLVMAYVMLGASAFPSARQEIQEARARKAENHADE